MLPGDWGENFDWSWRKAVKNYVPLLWNVSWVWVGSCLHRKVKLDPTSAGSPDQKLSMKTFFHGPEIEVTPFSCSCHVVRKFTLLFHSDWEAIVEAAWGKHFAPHTGRLSTCNSCSVRKAGDHFWNLWVGFSFTVRHLTVGVCNAEVYMGWRCLKSCYTQDIQSKEPRDYFGSPKVVVFFGWPRLYVASPLHLQYFKSEVDCILVVKYQCWWEGWEEGKETWVYKL